ncbi:Intermembrane phospholipid transport system binding protein MlaC [Paraburkholderia caffeinitolerans]|uniref:Intermembrane phospholipid transport system binding protein MlaC n=1 Tax=Paraburkholderia caffeinitolerans TaxID=1723730 RepID=A0A6J5H076_9BURK|nr:ABC transporter substrate-binding protein [Paraburkholderia caffeinitolerans]CAB3810246.1 Intermembrane phospholipid transport system binding protein MlaC [Paraburkholderia caffeinitolerans]
MKKLFFLSAGLAWIMASLVFGASAFAQGVDQSDPQALIKTATQQVLDEVRTKSIAPDDMARIRDIVDRDILPYVDFHRTTQLAMGRHWRTATPAQQQQVAQQFQLLLIHLYSGALAQLKPDQQIEYPPMRNAPGDTDVVVRALAQTSNNPVEIDYRLYKTPQGWRLYDLNVLGAWLIQTYRAQFNEQIQQSGVDGLIQFLTSRNQELEAAKP